MKKVFLLLILLFLVKHIFAERAIWVWDQAYKMVTDESCRDDFYSFINAPKGDNSKQINTIFFSCYKAIKYRPAETRELLADMHSRGLKVAALAGDKSWATPPHRDEGEDFLDDILSFNSNSDNPDERFDAVHYDVEPQALDGANDGYDWDDDNHTIWTTYIRLIKNCKSKIEAYNNNLNPDMEFGVDIAYWWDTDSHSDSNPLEVQTNVDYVGVMDYVNSSNQMINNATNECKNGDDYNKDVWLGVETIPSVVEWDDNDDMENNLRAVSNSTTGLGKYTSFKGFAIHYYETKYIESAYRKLSPETPGGHNDSPAPFLKFPNGDEGIVFYTNINIRWTNVEFDADPTTVNLQYSSNNGTNWLNLPSSDASNHSKSVDDGKYLWSISNIGDGSNYKVKLIVWDNQGHTNYDVSDYTFTINRTAASNTNEWSTVDDPGNEGCKPQIIYDDQNSDILHLCYHPWGSASLYYKKSTDSGTTWGSAVTISSSGSPKKHAMAVRNNKIAIVYLCDSGNDIRIRISTNGGTSFSSEETIDDGNSSSYKWQNFPDVAIDSSGNVHVVWSVRDDSNSYWRILYRYKTASWSSITTVDYYTMILKHPAVSVDSSDNIHIIYDKRSWSGSGYKWIRYRRKSSGGTWDTAVNIWSDAGANSWNNLLAPDITEAGGYLHAVWQKGGANPSASNTTSIIYYSRKTNITSGTWSSAVTIGTGYVPCIDARENDINIVWYDANSSKQVKYRDSNDKGVSFGDTVIIASSTSLPYYNYLTDFDPYFGIPYISTAKSGSAEGTSVICWRDDIDPKHIKYKFKESLLAPPISLYINLIEDSSTSLKLKWKPPSSYLPTKYKVYRCTNFSSYYTLVNENVFNTEYIDTGLSASGQYKYNVQAVSIDKESKKSKPSNLLSPGNKFLINYFEGNEGISSYTKYGTSTLTYSEENTIVTQGSKSQKLQYSYGGSGWGACLYSPLPAMVDISSYDAVKMWVKGDGSTNKIAIGFKESTGSGTDETWVAKYPKILTNTSWHLIEFPLDKFSRSDGVNNYVFDKDKVIGYQLTYTSKGSSSSYHYVDEIYCESVPMMLNISSATIGFGNISGNLSDTRVQATNFITVTYAYMDDPWYLRIYFDDNNDNTTNSGLQGQTDTSKWLPVKCWTPNFGPQTNTNSNMGPDEENLFFWNGYDFNDDGDKGDGFSSGSYVEGTNSGQYPFDLDGDGFQQGDTYNFSKGDLGEEAKWGKIPEKNGMNELDSKTWRVLNSTELENAEGTGSGGEQSEIRSTPVHFAVDLTSVKSQEYKGKLIIEIVIE